MGKLYNWKGYAWIIVFLSAFLLFYKYIIQVYPGLIAGDIKLHFGIDSSMAGGLIGITFYAIVIAQIFSGFLLDKFGFRLISAISLLIAAIGLIIFSQTESLAWAFAARMLMGIGVAFATVSYIKAVSVWFSVEKFAFVNSFLATAAMTGAVIGEAPLAYLFSKVGWHEGLMICAYIGIAGAIIYWFLVRNENPHYKGKERSVSLKRATVKDILHVFTRKENIMLAIYSGLTFTTVDAFAGLWGNEYIQELYHVSSTEAAGTISLIFVGMAIGSPIIGKISEIYDTRKMLMIGFHSLSILLLVLIFYMPMSHTLFAILLFVYGFSLGEYMLTFAMGRRINSVIVAASVAAIINTGEPILGGLFDPLVGWLLDLHGKTHMLNGVLLYNLHSYQVAFAVLPISLLIALFILFFIKDKKYTQNPSD